MLPMQLLPMVLPANGIISSEECFEGSITPIPPSLTGRAKRSRSASFGGDLPVKVGINFVPMMVSRGAR